MEKKRIKVDIGTPRSRGQADNQIAFLVEKYLERHPECFDQDGAIDVEAILDWAFISGIYKPEPADPKVQLRRRLTRHFGHRYKTDKQGRQVRALVAVPREQKTQDGIKRAFRYYPLFETQADVIFLGLDLRRGWAGKRVEQIETDRLSYNDNNIYGQTIEKMSYNFDAILERKSMPTTYPKSAPDDIDEEDDSIG